MIKSEIQDTLTYLNKLEEQLNNGDISQHNMTLEMHNIYKIIEKLMNDTYETTDQDLKAFLSTLELKARECYAFLKSRLAVDN